MAKKKSRKIGQIGIPKSSIPRTPNAPEGKKSGKGNKSGTRQQLTENNEAVVKKEKKDPRSGSKKAIDLNKYKAGAANQKPREDKQAKAVKYKTPQAEIDAIENNPELERLLEKQESSRLSSTEQAFVDKITSRYRDLCELVGIDVNEIDTNDKQEKQLQDDPFASLDAIKLDDFRD